MERNLIIDAIDWKAGMCTSFHDMWQIAPTSTSSIIPEIRAHPLRANDLREAVTKLEIALRLDSLDYDARDEIYSLHTIVMWAIANDWCEEPEECAKMVYNLISYRWSG